MHKVYVMSKSRAILCIFMLTLAPFTALFTCRVGNLYIYIYCFDTVENGA